jgi:hypothetical protein
MQRQYFEDNFYQDYIALASDKVSNIRLDFAKSLLVIKPFID